MFLSTIGHATLAIAAQAAGPPVLVTDPWIRGSCYWRSWWLERYPSQAEVDRIRAAEYCYLTHEHPDHFHTPSLRAIGDGPTYLVPEFARDMMGSYLSARGLRARTLPAGAWVELNDQLRVLSLPTIGNDSALLIDTPHAMVANLNDARPSPDQLLLLRRVRDSVKPHKPCVLLASYSAAGIGNSLFRAGKRIEFAGHDRHVRYVGLLARALRADRYVPFASQVRFERPDTRWANAFRVSLADVHRILSPSGLGVLPPYLTLDLATLAHTAEPDPPAALQPDITRKVSAQLAREAAALSSQECDALARKLRCAGGSWLALLFPRGIAFDFGEQRLHYDPWTRAVRPSSRSGSVRFRLPAQAVRDVLASGYFSDLCIPMFTEVHLGPETPPHAIYAFFVLVQLHDIGAIGDARALGRSLLLSLRERTRLWHAGR